MNENTGAAPQLNIAPQPPPSTPQPVTRLPSGAPVRKRGGQQGNHNARVHGFYSRNAPYYRQEIIDDAAELEGLDAEIAFLRSCIQYVSEMDPPNPKLGGELVRTLSIAIVRRKYSGHDVRIEKAKMILGGVAEEAASAARDAKAGQGIEK